MVLVYKIDFKFFILIKNIKYIMSTNMKYLNITIFIFLSLYCLVFSIYSGYTADNNPPEDNAEGLFVTSYVICILQCIIYFMGCIYIVFVGISSLTKNSNTDNSEYKSNGLLPLLLNIYWVVVYYNYDVSQKYNEFAKVKTIEFFTMLGLSVIIFCSICVFGFVIIKNVNNRKSLESNSSNSKSPESNLGNTCSEV